MKINNYGEVEISESEAFDALYAGTIYTLDNVHLDNDAAIEKYNSARNLNADRITKLNKIIHDQFDNVEMFDEANQLDWFMPKEYTDFPIVDWLYEQCATEREKIRVDQELILFIQHNMFDLLFYLKYLVDTMRKNKIVWGVGRGSSVASYILYLIGVHKIDSIRYELEITEFLK